MPLTIDEAFVKFLPDLKKIAKTLCFERLDPAVSDDDLVMETYVKAKAHTPSFQPADDRHAWMLLRRILIQVTRDQFRNRTAQKRGAGVTVVDDFIGSSSSNAVNALAILDALNRLGQIHAVAAQVVELKFFVGLNDREVAEVLDMSISTVRRHWADARQFLHSTWSKEISK